VLMAEAVIIISSFAMLYPQ